MAIVGSMAEVGGIPTFSSLPSTGLFQPNVDESAASPLGWPKMDDATASPLGCMVLHRGMTTGKRRLTFSALQGALDDIAPNAASSDGEGAADAHDTAPRNQGHGCHENIGSFSFCMGASVGSSFGSLPTSTVCVGSASAAISASTSAALPPAPERPVRRLTRKTKVQQADHHNMSTTTLTNNPAPMTPPGGMWPMQRRGEERRLSGKRTREERDSIGASARHVAMTRRAVETLGRGWNKSDADDGVSSGDEDNLLNSRHRPILRQTLDMTLDMSLGASCASLDHGLRAGVFDAVKSAVLAAEMNTSVLVGTRELSPLGCMPNLRACSGP